MKILFAIKALDDMSGGAERVLADVSGGLADKGYDVSIVSFDRAGGQSFYPLHANVERIALGVGDVTKRATFFETVQRIFALRKAVLEHKPDVCIAFMHSAFIPAGFALVGSKVPVIASEHTVPAHYKDRRVEHCLFLCASLFIKKITVLSEAVRASYTLFLQKKMVVVANPVDAAKILADPLGAEDERKIILNVGRLTNLKNQTFLIHAFATLAADYPDWDLRIVGEGELYEALEDLIQRYGLENRVFLVGTISEISSEYQAAHIFALPSVYESFGLATAEAMAHGLPALGLVDCPGTNELIVDGQNGLLVREALFADGLKRLMDSDSLRATLGAQGVERVQVFSKGHIIQAWEDLILGVCSDENPTRFG